MSGKRVKEEGSSSSTGREAENRKRRRVSRHGRKMSCRIVQAGTKGSRCCMQERKRGSEYMYARQEYIWLCKRQRK